MRISDPWVEAPHIQALMGALATAGHQAYFVGGCVRNALLNVAVSDIDISTDARPEAVMTLAETLGFSAHPTGIDHGTVTVAHSGDAVEVTTFRRDVETDGRRAVVAFADTIEEDALRRDFTMNALYADRFGTVLDPLGTGKIDLRARRVRFIEDADTRIREDYLRILRFFRFHAHFGDANAGLDPAGLSACEKLSDGLLSLSKERIGAEMLKLLAADNPSQAVAAMEYTGCLARILPGANGRWLTPLIHLEQGVRPDAIRRLVALGAAEVKSALRLSKAAARRWDAVLDASQSETEPAELAYRLGLEVAQDAVLVRCAMLGEERPEDLSACLKIGAGAQFPVSAADLPTLEGAEIGKALREMEQRWIESGFTAEKSALLAGLSL